MLVFFTLVSVISDIGTILIVNKYIQRLFLHSNYTPQLIESSATIGLSWGSVVSSPSGIRGGAPAANDFSIFLSLKNDAGGTSNGVFWHLVEGQL